MPKLQRMCSVYFKMFQIILSEREAETRLLVTLEIKIATCVEHLFCSVLCKCLNKYLINILCLKFLMLLNIIHITW